MLLDFWFESEKMMEGGILIIQLKKLCVNEFFVYTVHQHGSIDLLKSEQSLFHFFIFSFTLFSSKFQK